MKGSPLLLLLLPTSPTTWAFSPTPTETHHRSSPRRNARINPVFDEVCETTGVTLTRFMNEVATLNPEIRELTTLFGAIDTACKAMTNLVKRSQLPKSGMLGLQGGINVQGEDQKKLDVITNELLKRHLRFTGRLGVLASEEEDAPVSIQFIGSLKAQLYPAPLKKV